jgi:hypothetical protein
MDVDGWLRNLGLGKYEAAIRDNGVIQLGRGALTVTGKGSSLTIGAAGKLLGFGVVDATTLTNSGLIETWAGR